MPRELKYFEAIREALGICLDVDPRVYLMGLGVPDPKGIFGTTFGLAEKYGKDRILDMPCAENGMTGVAIGSALVGMRPVMTHQRIDFAVVAMEQIANQAAKWHYMFGGRLQVPLVIRVIIGRGWGQGPQHSQSLQAWFAHVPGLRVVMPTTPHDAKGMLIASIADDNPVVFVEHRWLHNIKGPVPEGSFTVPLGLARVAREGKDVTIVALSYMTLEALRAAEWLAKEAISAEVIDLRSLQPLDDRTILRSVQKTGRLVVADTAWTTGGFAGEVVARVVEQAFGDLIAAPQRVALPDCPTPTSPALSASYYPRADQIVYAARKTMGCPEGLLLPVAPGPYDVPDSSFQGPF